MKRPRRILVILLISMPFMAGASHSSPSRDDDVRSGVLDVKKGTDYLIFDGEINGEKCAIALDTGAYTSAVSADLARKLNIKGAKGTVKVALGGLTIDQLAVAVVDFRRVFVPFGKAGAQAVLGHNFVAETLTVCDYPKGRVAFFSSKTKRGYDALKDSVARTIGGTEGEIPMDIVFVDDHALVPTKVDDTLDIHFGIDTGGSQVNTMSQTGMEAFNKGKDVKISIRAGGHTFNDVRFVK